MRIISKVLGKTVGPSTGTHFWQMCRLRAEMRRENDSGSIVSVLCDSGERYRDTLYDDAWLSARGFDLSDAMSELQAFIDGNDQNLS